MGADQTMDRETDDLVQARVGQGSPYCEEKVKAEVANSIRCTGTRNAFGTHDKVVAATRPDLEGYESYCHSSTCHQDATQEGRGVGKKTLEKTGDGWLGILLDHERPVK